MLDKKILKLLLKFAFIDKILNCLTNIHVLVI